MGSENRLEELDIVANYCTQIAHGEGIMAKLFHYRVQEAYEKCGKYLSEKGHKRSVLADELWAYKRPDDDIDPTNREYVSWVNSLPCLLECAKSAKLDNTIVVFEMKTPVSRKAVDVIMLGTSPTNELRVAIFELKQWDDNDISRRVFKSKFFNHKKAKFFNHKKVYVRSARQRRRHPFFQLNLYEKNLMQKE